LLLQAAYCDYQIGAFENFHQLVEDTLIVLRPGPKIFFQYELRFANCLNCQLLISHPFLPHQTNGARRRRKQNAQTNRMSGIKSILGNVPVFFRLIHQFLFQCGSPQRTIAAASCSTSLQTSTHMGLDWWRLNPALSVSDLKDVLGPYQHTEDLARYAAGLR
jgi:hypothetical protein